MLVGRWVGRMGGKGSRGSYVGCPEAEVGEWMGGMAGRYDGWLAVKWVWTKI